jgi:hypothetical protein
LVVAVAEKINLAELRDFLALGAPGEYRRIERESALALIEAVEAAHALMRGPGGTPGLINGRKLDGMLAHFDFGERP